MATNAVNFNAFKHRQLIKRRGADVEFCLYTADLETAGRVTQGDVLHPYHRCQDVPVTLQTADAHGLTNGVSQGLFNIVLLAFDQRHQLAAEAGIQRQRHSGDHQGDPDLSPELR